jgi:hypothetical protein
MDTFFVRKQIVVAALLFVILEICVMAARLFAR